MTPIAPAAGQEHPQGGSEPVPGLPVPPDAVEAAAKAVRQSCKVGPFGPNASERLRAGEGVWLTPREAKDLATAALAAAAPLIAQQALEDAAQVWGEGVWADAYWAFPVLDDASSVQATTRWLTARAATLTPKDTP